MTCSPVIATQMMDDTFKNGLIDVESDDNLETFFLFK